MGPIHGLPGFHDKIKGLKDVLTNSTSGDPAAGVQVMMDFDLTITAPGSEQCHHMFETYSFGQFGVIVELQVYAVGKIDKNSSSAIPTEIRSTLTPYIYGEVELSYPEEWWDKFHRILISAKLTREQVASVAAGANVSLRHGADELLFLLNKLRVPLLIVSAGISDIIEETLGSRGLLLDNITIYANRMIFDEHGTLQGFSESIPLTSRNKRRTAERQLAYFTKHAGRGVVIVVGDKPGDVDVNDGVASDENCLKIGFFDHSDEHPHPSLPQQRPLTPSSGDGKPPHKVPLLQETRKTNTNVVRELWSESEKKSRGNFLSARGRRDDEIRWRGSAAAAAVDSGGKCGSSSETEVSFLQMVDIIPHPRNEAPDGEAGMNSDGGSSDSSACASGIFNHGERVGLRDDPESTVSSSGRHNSLSSTDQPIAAVLSPNASPGATGAITEDGRCPNSDIDGKFIFERENVAVKTKLKEMLRIYRERFDIVAHGDHSMEIVSVAVRYLVQNWVESN